MIKSGYYKQNNEGNTYHNAASLRFGCSCTHCSITQTRGWQFNEILIVSASFRDELWDSPPPINAQSPSDAVIYSLTTTIDAAYAVKSDPSNPKGCSRSRQNCWRVTVVAVMEEYRSMYSLSTLIR